MALQPQHLGRRIHAVERRRAIGEADRAHQLEQAIAEQLRKPAHHLACDGGGALVEPDHARAQRQALAIHRHHAAHLRGEHHARRTLTKIGADIGKPGKRRAQRRPPVERILLGAARTGIGDGIGVVGGMQHVEIGADQANLQAARTDVHRNDEILIHSAPETK